jgi:benzoyl-CoA reductase subunit C
MWQLLRPGAYVKYLDVPQSLRPDLGGAFFERELRDLRTDLARLAGRPITDADLRRGIEAENARRRALEEVYALRRERPWLAPTSELYLLLRAGDLLPVEEHTAMLLEYRALAAASGRPVEDQARVALTGAFCERPPLGLIQTIERSGCAIVEDDLALGLRYIRGDVEVAPGEDPLVALARAFLTQGRRCQTMFLPDGAGEGKGAALVDEARAAGAEGVIFAAASFCDPALLDQPMTARAVEAAGLPSTSFKFAENAGQFQPIREQTGAFADAIKIWSEG